MDEQGLIQYAVDELTSILDNSYDYSVEQFKALDDPLRLHSTLGMYIRNKWGLWEEDESKKSALVKYFNSIGIYHADDMSSIMLKVFHDKLHNRSTDIAGQAKMYIDYWKKEGYRDGNPYSKLEI